MPDRLSPLDTSFLEILVEGLAGGRWALATKTHHGRSHATAAARGPWRRGGWT